MFRLRYAARIFKPCAYGRAALQKSLSCFSEGFRAQLNSTTAVLRQASDDRSQAVLSMTLASKRTKMEEIARCRNRRSTKKRAVSPSPTRILRGGIIRLKKTFRRHRDLVPLPVQSNRKGYPALLDQAVAAIGLCEHSSGAAWLR